MTIAAAQKMRWGSVAARGLAAALGLFATSSALAQETEGYNRYCDPKRGTISATWENDIFAGTDSDYTNGVRLSYVTPCGNHFLVDRWLKEQIAPFYDNQGYWYGLYAVGQNMYTPEDIEIEFPEPDERPYAGFLYGSVGVMVDSRAKHDEFFDTLDSYVLDIGVVGNASNAEHTQKLVHDIINDRKPVGWDDQLEDELGLRLMFERKWRYLQDVPVPVFPLQADVIPHLGLSLGNVDTSAAAGAIVRIGASLDDDYGPPRVRPGIAGPGVFNGDDGFGWYLFAGGEGRGVLRDIFLQGNTFQDSKSVDIHHFVFEGQAGAAVQIGASEVAFTYVARTPQYERQSGWSQFGSVNMRFRF